MMFLISSILTQLFPYSTSTPYFVTPLSIECSPCTVPHSQDIQWIPYSRPACFHEGQPIFNWPTSGCPDLKNLKSKQISLEDGIVFAKQRLCFYYTFHEIQYDASCQGKRHKGHFQLGHKLFSLQRRRVKRWLRRRNPNSATVHFQQERYVKEVSEDVAVGSVIDAVKATHLSDQPIYYSMVAPQDSRSQNLFMLDTTSGEIRLAKSLDREVLDRHVLKVSAYERADPSVAATTTVVIDVLDVQDNSPVFERDSYFADIREDAPIGTTVVSVFARDLDAGSNGEVEYSLSRGEGAEFLSIHTKSGVIQTSAPLDRETLSLIRLDVIARDKGNPPRESSATVEIAVLDVNDNAPVFEKDAYEVHVSENVSIPTVIVRVQATDKDGPAYGTVHYSIVATGQVPLTMDYSTGEVTLRERLDARHSPLTVVVRAKDNAQPALSTTVPLTIHVEDINDHAPRFIAVQKQIFLEESVSIGEEVAKIYAIDDDSDDNGLVRYSLTGSDHFAIDAESGILRTTILLDRETQASYELTIRASDQGVPAQYTDSSISVVLRDVNDNAPEFEDDVVNVTLSEETPRGTQILVLKATDKDEDQKLVYRIESSERDVVSLNDLGNQAVLFLSDDLQAAHGHFQIRVSATDQGGLQGEVLVNVVVDDVNAPPFFVEHPFSVKIPEDSPIGFHVVTVKAEDLDRGENARVQYILESEEFVIDETSGLITLITSLDRETRSSYTLSVTARDSAVPPLNTTTQIEIIVDDVNDNSPVFSSENYETSVPEDVAVGTSFLQVTAKDLDLGSNGMVDYFLNTSDSTVGLDLFRLDRTSGTLRVNAPLDREKSAVLVLPIFAQDRGIPFRSSSSSITVKLEDVNDNAPMFPQTSYDLYVEENTPIGTVVGSLSAFDPDEDENAKIEFRIFGGMDAKLFDIETDENQPGVVRILTRAIFDYEAKNNRFYVEVQASSGQLSSTVPVRVHVSDINDNRPELRDFVIFVVRLENSRHQAHVGTIPAFDPDHNATLEYFLESNNLVEADRQTGKLRLLEKLNRKLEASFKTCVSDGANTVCAECRLIHIYLGPEHLREVVSVRVQGISIDEFWDPQVFDRFRESISTVANWRSSDVLIVSVRKMEDAVVVDLLVETMSGIVRSWQVVELLAAAAPSIAQRTQLRLRVEEDKVCRNEPCPYFQKCRHTLKYDNDMELFETDNFIAKTLKTVKTFVCECPTGFTSSAEFPGQCDIRLDQCFNGPCKNNGVCFALEGGFRCECAEGWTGTDCSISTNALTCLPGFCLSGSQCDVSPSRTKCRLCPHKKWDVDDRCRLRSLSFEGSGVVNVNHQIPRFQWSLSLSVATIAHEGIIVFSGEKDADFFELSIQDRTLRVEFSLGDQSKVVKLDMDIRNRMNSGQWRTINLRYYDRRMTIWLDDCERYSALHAVGALPCAATTKIDLPAKCLDPLVPCFRFLDLHNGIFVGGRPVLGNTIEQPFKGCVANLTLDGKLIDFSTIDKMDKIGTVTEGCPPKRDYCSETTCASNAKCVNLWNGNHCRCQHSLHESKKCTNDAQTSRALQFVDEESFVVFEPDASSPSLAHSVSLPLTFSIEFRTSRIDTQIFVIEFDQRSIFYKLELEDGQFRATMGAKSTWIAAPEFHAGHWMRAEIEFSAQQTLTIINALYEAVIVDEIDDVHPDVLYSGLAPSMGHPSRYDGLLRNVRMNNQPMHLKHKGKVRYSNQVQNRCSLQDICPPESRCIRQWDRHQCQCHKGFAGDVCEPVCSLRGICGAEGLCQPTNNSHGYECQCSQGFSGRNCEEISAEKECPMHWWGSFPECKKCECDPQLGFRAQCHKQTGKCNCQKQQYLSAGRCVACECGLGSGSLECDFKGQCPCKGDATGRRCDRCAKPDQTLEPKSLKCVTIKNRCPSQVDNGILWPITTKGTVARQSCPGLERGLATRECGEAGWKTANHWNCTRHEFSIMMNKFDLLESAALLNLLSNATSCIECTQGRNLEIASGALDVIVENQKRLNTSRREHIRDEQFSTTLAASACRILSQQDSHRWLHVAQSLFDYGRSVLETHRNNSFLSPFALNDINCLFAIDRLDFSHIVPKFNNFIDKRPKHFPRVQIHLKAATQVFYSILSGAGCSRCESPVVLVTADTILPIRVDFPLDEDSGWKYPQCSVLKRSYHPSWSTVGASLVGLNLTHVSCEFSISGIYTVFVKADRNSYLRLSSSESLASPVIAAVALLFCIFSFISTLLRKGIRTRLIRLAFIFFFSLHALNIFFLHRIIISQVFCPMRNALLSFTTCAPFAWLFLYSLHLYRMLADGNPKSSASVCLLIGVVLPCVLSTSSFFAATSCSLQPQHWLFWIIVIPIALFLLLAFYASATSLIISMGKQYDVFVVKFNLRKALVQHFILTFLTVVYTSISLFLPLFAVSTPLRELLCNISFVVVALYILAWSVCPSNKTSGNSAAALWVDEPKADADHAPFQSSPLLPKNDFDSTWMPDVIPADPYLTTTPTLDRAMRNVAAAHDVEVSSPRSTMDIPIVHSILSPAERVIGNPLENFYGNLGTLSRFRTETDDTDDAYYTYTASRRHHPGTFNRE